jgi:hypothetical protein
VSVERRSPGRSRGLRPRFPAAAGRHVPALARHGRPPGQARRARDPRGGSIPAARPASMLGAMPATTSGHIAPSGPAPPRGGPGLPRTMAMWVRRPRPDCPGPADSGPADSDPADWPADWPAGSGPAARRACSGSAGWSTRSGPTRSGPACSGPAGWSARSGSARRAGSSPACPAEAGSARRAGSGSTGYAASHDGSSARPSLEPKSSWRTPGQFAVACGEPSGPAATGRTQCRVLPSRGELAEPAERPAKGGPRHHHSVVPGAYPMRRRGGLPIRQDALMVRA